MGTCRDTLSQCQGTQAERPDHIQAFKYKQVSRPWIFGRGLKQRNALWQNYLTAEKTWSWQQPMGMPRAQRRWSETCQLYQQTISFLFQLGCLVCVFTGFVTSKNLAIESYNKAYRMSQNYKTSEKVTTFYCLSNKRWDGPGQDRETVEQFKTVKPKANLGKRDHFLVSPAPPLLQYLCTQKAAHQYNYPFFSSWMGTN